MKPRRGTLGLLLLGCIGGASLGLSVYEKDFLMSSAGRQREESSKLVRRRDVTWPSPRASSAADLIKLIGRILQWFVRNAGWRGRDWSLPISS
ncbi:hypothetical protein RRG08_016960 [Elysia crispata]|uniref:Uncharacterized protein n=1 Tax=Elysia crispata TaxID=231223 RepID=A0AAE0XZ86_9GAST|nr:hypothetical protein RRG08_016960 [Elysia crispata]